MRLSSRSVPRLVLLAIVMLVCSAKTVRGEILVRWNQEQTPSRQMLGVTTLVVPDGNAAAVRRAVTEGYQVYVEVDAARLAAFTPAETGVHGVIVTGKASAQDLDRLRARVKVPANRVLLAQAGAKWPHIRTNWVTRNNDVLQVAGRSAQPWIENNAALLRILHAAHPDTTPLLTYTWQASTVVEAEEGPSLEHYLVAIAEAGSFGGHLLLPLHERFEQQLLAGDAAARADWIEIRRYIDFYAREQPRYKPLANVAVVTSQPMVWFEAMNLLARHNLPFELVSPAAVATRDLRTFGLLIVFDAPERPQLEAIDRFARGGGKVHRVSAGVQDPNGFALEMRKLLGAGDRLIDIWNGITVLVAPYRAPDGDAVLVTALNYAHQALPVQLRVRGSFGAVRYESPEEPAALVPHQLRNGYTEFVLPSLRVGARVWLTRGSGHD